MAILEAAGLDPEVARDGVRAAEAHPAVVGGRSHAERLEVLASLLATRSALYRQAHAAPRVERRHRLDPAEFFTDYYRRNRPVVIEGLLEDWPALKRWTPAWMAERFGDERVEVMAGRDAQALPDFHADRLRREVSLRELLSRFEGAPTNDMYLVARNSLLLRDAFRPLLEDLRAPEGYIHPDLDGPDRVHVWLGPAGTLSNLHHDHLNVLFCQVWGRKQVWLAPSWETPWMSNVRGFYSAVDVMAPDTARFPDFARVALHTVEVGPGDVLFLPVGWWHALRALDPSLSVTFVNFEQTPGLNSFWREGWLGATPQEEDR
ncbi:cupin-like domain-containing protein [Corallococcus sp. CA053C]|uniref:cupin-like domain-containing protein n=1 Tax=Corallococcus sp. CA053C TaxID=2316732 RepID=UPI001F1CAE54|nr:cupin-like domain-containing protein [Corallococcus sp. CA053C]